ncbi:kelch domain-containing protein 9 isoform X1 [Alligator mississippiensis]|uniref:kelch domain-containing protein 9 isoform X1 n=2 Tax=Alligator mississippiensis TaxID=8496 RepID=UPI00287789D0|nr:kelch domain-containing protein 9 isoform X1 [Alligator mississippiensis]
MQSWLHRPGPTWSFYPGFLFFMSCLGPNQLRGLSSEQSSIAQVSAGMSAAPSLWDWKPVARDALLARAHHSCDVVRGKLLLFGGLRSGEPKEPPLGDTVAFDPVLLTAETVVPDSGDPRSHHDTAVLADRWLCVVGGWDGAHRISSVGCFDAEQGRWERWAEGPSNDPPVGLSSHTCTKVSEHELRVVGRQGGLRTQRRFASLYTLRVNPTTKTYWYKEEDLRLASRAGHSAMLLHDPGGYRLVVFGGRDSCDVEVAGRWSKTKIHVEPVHAPKLTAQLSRLVGSGRGSPQAPKGLRHQSCSVVGPFAVVFGGETLAKGRDAVCNDLYIYDTRCSSPSWLHFPGSDRRQKRVGHRTCLWDDKLYLVGGFGPDGKTPCPEVCVLDVPE